MTIGHEDELDALKHIGAIVARALRAMLSAIEPGMTTRELDDLGRAALERAKTDAASMLEDDKVRVCVGGCELHPNFTLTSP